MELNFPGPPNAVLPRAGGPTPPGRKHPGLQKLPPIAGGLLLDVHGLLSHLQGEGTRKFTVLHASAAKSVTSRVAPCQMSCFPTSKSEKRRRQVGMKDTGPTLRWVTPLPQESGRTDTSESLLYFCP